MISGRNPPISSRMSPHPHPHSHDQLRPPSAEPPPLPFPLVRSVGGCARRSLSRERSCYIRRSAKVTEDAGRMSKAVSKAPDSGQATSAPKTRRTRTDGRPSTNQTCENPNRVRYRRRWRRGGGGPKTVLVRGRGISLPSPPPQRRQRYSPKRRGGAMRGEKRDLTALELRTGHGDRGRWEPTERDGGMKVEGSKEGR